MSTTLRTPGVYIEEISKLPPSVAQVQTAIPAFVGYTAKATKKIDNDLDLVPTRIVSMLEYVTYFGEANELEIKLEDDVTTGMPVLKELSEEKFLMYYALQMYFANGGGPCYIVSVGTYTSVATTPMSQAELKKGLDTLERQDEPTLLLFPDATSLTEIEFYGIYQDALLQANKMQDRFVIMDTYLGTNEKDTDGKTTVDKYREAISGDKYGAAYYPHLNTILNYKGGTITSHEGTGYDYATEKAALTDIVNDTTITNAATAEANEDKAQKIIDTINSTLDTPIPANLDVSSGSAFKTSITDFLTALGTKKDVKGAFETKKLAEIKELDPTRYGIIQKQIQAIPVVLPPSATIAGVYAKVDSTRGVWKSPANVGLSYVSSLTEKVTNDQQDDLNVDTTAGKSINAIRSFTGKGIVVWGARTLEGNSNEWRYISVRRFFNMVEESVKKAVEAFVFESNDANTWIKIKAMIENFLNLQWQAGALAGATPTEAYFVSVGLGETMTAQDILEGRLNVEIGMAAVRPAEFIILKFSQKLQES